MCREQTTALKKSLHLEKATVLLGSQVWLTWIHVHSLSFFCVHVCARMRTHVCDCVHSTQNHQFLYSGFCQLPEWLCSLTLNVCSPSMPWLLVRDPIMQSTLDPLLLSEIWKTIYLESFSPNSEVWFFLSPYFQIWHFAGSVEFLPISSPGSYSLISVFIVYLMIRLKFSKIWN